MAAAFMMLRGRTALLKDPEGKECGLCGVRVSLLCLFSFVKSQSVKVPPGSICEGERLTLSGKQVEVSS